MSSLRIIGVLPNATWLLFLGVSLLASLLQPAHAADFYVARNGNDSNPGTRSRPFATIAGARDAIRALPRPLTESITVWVRGGTYPIEQPIVFGTQDGGSATYSISYRAEPDEQVLISGGLRITGWERHAGDIWKAPVPLNNGQPWAFRYLWADGERMTRARHPNDPQMWQIAELTPDFLEVKLNQPLPAGLTTSSGDVELVIETEWTNARDVIDHVSDDWLHMKSTVGLVNNSNVCAKVGNRAFLENSLAFVDQPGEWYLDRGQRMLYVYWGPGVDPNAVAVFAPRASQLLRVAGTDSTPILNLHFRDLNFAHSDWQLPDEGYAGIQACVYASGQFVPSEGVERRSYMLPLAVHFEFTRNCSLQGSRIRSVAGNGFGFARGCLDNLIEGCEIADTSGNGLLVSWIEEIPRANWYYWWTIANRQPWDVNRRNIIRNNYIHHVGQEFWEGVGVLDMFAQGSQYLYNEIAHTGSGAMTIGYCWDPVSTPQSETIIQNNDIHHFCKRLGDSGGIYTLGFNPNASIRNNFIRHNMRRPSWLESPAFGLYYDQASQGITSENNVIYLTQTPGFAREWNEPVNIHTLLTTVNGNTVRNNYIHAFDIGLFRYDATPPGNLAQSNNATLAQATDLDAPAVAAIVRNAGLQEPFRSRLKLGPGFRLRHLYTFDNPSDFGADSVGSIPMWLDHGPYIWPGGISGGPEDFALGLTGATGAFGGIHFEYFQQDLGSQFSIAMFIKPEEKSTDNNMQGLVANTYPGSLQDGFRWTLNRYQPDAALADDGTIGFETGDGASYTSPFSAGGVVTTHGGWQHLAITIDKLEGKVRAYVNGVRVLDSLVETFFASGPQYIFIGSIGNDYNFQGTIDEVRIYEGLITESEITRLATRTENAARHWSLLD